MFREMRRINQQMTAEECEAVLARHSYGVLALYGDQGYPYALPVNYLYLDGRIYYHGAKTGHKMDAIAGEPKCSFCVVDEDQIMADQYTSYIRSVILFGKARVLTDEEEIRRVITAIGRKFNPFGADAPLESSIAKNGPGLAVVCIDVEHMTGKESMELKKLD